MSASAFGRPPALEPLESAPSARPDLQAGSKGTLTNFNLPRAQSEFNQARDGLKTSGTFRNPLGATSNLSEADTIKVAVRVRPLFPAEKEKGATQVVEVSEDHSVIKLVIPGPAGSKMQRDFAFHACLGPEVGQTDVLHMCGIPQLLEAALSGYNVTVFAYGQTGSGKTFTMSGREDIIGTDEYKGGDTNDGIMSRAVGYLYQSLKERKDQTKFSISASYLEIYNEGIYDLLNLRSKNLPVKWDATQGFFVPGLKAVTCGDVTSMMEIIRTGMKHRHVGSHELNIESSRSHSIMTVTCCATPIDPNSSDFGTSRYGKICFVDLAGSERLKDSKSEGVMLKETANINKSLFVLGKVISALAERDSSGVTSSHIPYRDSKLTKLLMDSLGGCAMALMIACCSPSSLHVEETLSTLSYATRAKNIQNRPVIQYDPKEQQIAALRREIDLLRQENMYLREQIQMGGGGVPHTPLRDSVGEGIMELPPAGADADGSSAPPQWPQLQYSPSATPGQQQQQQQQQSQQQEQQSQLKQMQAQLHALMQQAGGAGPPMRSASPRLGSGSQVPVPSPRASPLAVSFAASAVHNSGGGGGGSTWSMLEPRSESPMNRGGVGTSSESLPSLSGAAGAANANIDFNKRLKETQALLSRFAEENNRLAKENDRLRTTRTVLGAEHADVLDEIEQLRSHLSGLESAVMTGSFSPSDIKMLLSGIKQVQAAPKTGSNALHQLRSSFSAAAASPLGATPSHVQQQQHYSPSGGSWLSTDPPRQTYSSDLHQQQQPEQQQQPPGSAQSAADPPLMHAPHPPTSQPGSGIARRSSGSSGGSQPSSAASPGPPAGAAPPHPGPGPGPHKPEVANVMSMGSSTQAAMRTRQGNTGGGTGGGAGSGGIIVADQSKLSLLLGLGGGDAGGSAAPSQAHGYPPAPPQQQHGPQGGMYMPSPHMPHTGGFNSQPGSAHGWDAPYQSPMQPPMQAPLRPLPVKPGGDPLNPAKQAHEQAIIRKIISSGQSHALASSPMSSPANGAWGRG